MSGFFAWGCTAKYDMGIRGMMFDLTSILLTICEPNSWEDDDNMCFSSKALENAVPMFHRFTNGNSL